MGRQAVGLDPAGPRPRRAVRSLRARRRPVRERRAGRVGVRPARQRRLGRAARRHRTLVAVPRRPRRTAGGGPGWRRRAAGRGLRPLDGRARRRRLPPERPAQAGPRGPRVARPRFGAARLEEVGLAPILARVTPTLAIPNGIDGSTLSRDATVGEKAGADPRNGDVEHGQVRRRGAGRAGARSTRAPRPGSASRRSSSTAWTTASSRRRRPRSSKAPRASSAARSRASATSSTTNPRAPRSSRT